MLEVEDTFEEVGEELLDVAVGVELEGAIGRFAKELDGLVGLALGDAVRRTAELRAQLEAVEVELVGAFDRSMEWSLDGFRHPTSWLKTECRVPRAVAGKKVALSRKLVSMPHTAEACACGAIQAAHVDRLARCNSPQRAQVFGEAEAMLVADAIELGFDDFAKAVDYFEQLVDNDDKGDDATVRRDEQRMAHSSRLFNSMGKVDAVLDPVGWAEFDTVLRQIENELFEADWAAVTAEHGDAATFDMVERTAPQRRADAMVEMAKRAAAVPEGARRPEPSVIVHIDFETFEAELQRRVGADFDFPTERLCELQDGTVVTPGEAVALAIEGHVRRMVFDPEGVVLEFGRKKRFFTGGLREMIEARDRHCTGPGCEVPWWDCDVDHIIDWQHLGETGGDNGELKCRWHNQHKSEYSIRQDPTTGRAHWRKRG